MICIAFASSSPSHSLDIHNWYLESRNSNAKARTKQKKKAYNSKSIDRYKIYLYMLIFNVRSIAIFATTDSHSQTFTRIVASPCVCVYGNCVFLFCCFNCSINNQWCANISSSLFFHRPRNFKKIEQKKLARPDNRK